MSNTSNVENKPASPGLELFKAASMFISSVVIASAGIFVTVQYNSSQLVISRNKELAGLIPQLGSNDANIRRFSAISLGLYGKEAVPALIATLDDERTEVRTAATKSLTMMGETAIPMLTKAYQNKGSSSSVRAICLYTLGDLRASQASPLAIEALQNTTEDPSVRRDAATALGCLQEKKAIPALLAALQRSKYEDSTLSHNIIWALGEIKDSVATKELLKLLTHRDSWFRVDVVWGLAQIGSDAIVERLSKVEASDSSALVREAARNAIGWYRRTH